MIIVIGTMVAAAPKPRKTNNNKSKSLLRVTGGVSKGASKTTNPNPRNELRPVLKKAPVNISNTVTKTFRAAVQEHLKSGQQKNYPVNYESRYMFQYVINKNDRRPNQGLKSNSFTAGNFNSNGTLKVSGNAGYTKAPNVTNIKGYNNNEVLNNILIPLVKTYAPAKYRNGANLNKNYFRLKPHLSKL